MRKAAAAAAAALMLIGLVAPAASAAVTCPAEPGWAWPMWKARFLSRDGRVVDTGNKGVSHSEGQGYGMVLAEAHGDKAAFDAIWSWTDRALAVRSDGLLSWRFVPGQGVTDPNNATDGDVLVAWGLVRAGRRWHDDALTQRGRFIASSVMKLRRDRAGLAVLLPGAAGFENGDVLEANPSYAVYPAYADFHHLAPDEGWDRVSADALRLTELSSAGKLGLPADWVSVDSAGVRPSPTRPPLFGYEGVRIPLYLTWSGQGGAPVMARIHQFWSGAGKGKAEVDLETGGQPEGPAPKAFLASAALAAAAVAGTSPDLPAADPRDDYYSATLAMLASVACREGLSK